MNVEEAIREFVAGQAGSHVMEHFAPSGLENGQCLGVRLNPNDSYMNFLMDLTSFFDEKGIDDPDFLLEGASVEEADDQTVVYFPAISD